MAGNGKKIMEGHVISGDEPLAKCSSRMCVTLIGRNLEINDYRKNGTPTLPETIHESVLDAYGRAIHF